MDKKEDKFKFVDLEEIESDSEDIVSNIEIVDTPEEISVGESDYDTSYEIGENNKEESNEVNVSNINIEENEIKGKHHFSFELRVIVMIFLILVLFGGACLLIFKVLQSTETNYIDYTEVGKVNYQVCNIGEDSICEDENLLYDSSKIKSINATFDYNMNLKESTEYSLIYHISAITTIYDKNDHSKVLYKNENVLVDRTDISDNKSDFNIYKTVTYDYLKDNKYVIDYKDVYKNDYVADVEIALYLDGEFEDESRKVSFVTIPFNNKSVEVEKYNINASDKLAVSTNNWDKYTIMCAAIASVLIIISLILIYKTTHLVLKVTNNRSKYQQRLMQILRDYDRIIVIARDGYETNKTREVVKLDNFDKLLDVKDNLNKPIIFSKINDVKSEFIVEDDEKLYKFVLKDDEV